jgi:hypothetical protein
MDCSAQSIVFASDAVLHAAEIDMQASRFLSAAL